MSVPNLESAVMVIGFWAQANFFYFDLGLGFSGQAILLILLKNEFSKIKNFAYWRVCVWGDFNQV
jgi:hypothetical protein